MNTSTIKRVCIIAFSGTFLTLAACNHAPEKWKMPNMTALTPRLQPIFEKTKTVCFGRFTIDVPASTIVVWGDTIVPLGVTVYPGGADDVKNKAHKFAAELKDKKAIYHNRAPLLIADEDVAEPLGRIITGYENFEAINALKINGYFQLNDDGIIINSHPLKSARDETTSLINSIARRLRQRTEHEIPFEPGNCIEHAFLIDDTQRRVELLEHIRIGFRLKEFPDAHLSIYVAPSNSDNPEGDSLQAQWKRMRENLVTSEEKKALTNTKFFREQPRQIHNWATGYEVLTRSPDEDNSHSHHDFQIKFIGVPHDPYRPYADIQFRTGVANNAAGATKASLTDEEAIEVWDKITSTIRVRPTSATPAKTAGAGPQPQIPLGELAATGRACPQTGWWEADDRGTAEGDRRRHFNSGERMPHVVSLGEPSLWQKLKGERPSYRTATVWKLVAYGEAPTQAFPANLAANHIPGSAADTGGDDERPTNNQG